MQIVTRSNLGMEAGMKMVKTTSNVRRLCDKKGWSKDDFIGHMMLVGVKPITSKRIYDGETNIRVNTAALVAHLLGVGLGEVIEISYPKK